MQCGIYRVNNRHRILIIPIAYSFDHWLLIFHRSFSIAEASCRESLDKSMNVTKSVTSCWCGFCDSSMKFTSSSSTLKKDIFRLTYERNIIECLSSSNSVSCNLTRNIDDSTLIILSTDCFYDGHCTSHNRAKRWGE